MRGGQRDGAGRPPDANARREVIQVRVTAEEKARVIEAVTAYGARDVSDLVRRALGLKS
jgi:hypothetical protein